MELFIQSMVSERCRMVVESELSKLGIRVSSVESGMVHTQDDVSDVSQEALKINLHNVGLELISDKKLILIERIKHLIIDSIQYSDRLINTNFSHYISKQLNYNYTYLANVFSKIKGMSIQRFIILIKVEKVKELLLYDELNLSQISDKLHYSSVSHLSHQFKKITGMAPSFFKRLKKRRKQNLEDL